jgi:hypothetical protein
MKPPANPGRFSPDCVEGLLRQTRELVDPRAERHGDRRDLDAAPPGARVVFEGRDPVLVVPGDRPAPPAPKPDLRDGHESSPQFHAIDGLLISLTGPPAVCCGDAAALLESRGSRNRRATADRFSATRQEPEKTMNVDLILESTGNRLNLYHVAHA